MKTDVVCAIFVINFSMLKNFLFSTDIGKRFIRLDKTKRCAESVWALLRFDPLDPSPGFTPIWGKSNPASKPFLPYG